MASLAGPCSNVVERWRGGERAPVSVSISAPARTAIVSSLRAGAPLPMIRFALRSATRELLIVIFRLSLMAPSPDDSCDVKKIVSPDARVCTGRGFAMMEATQLLAALARRFCLRLRRVPGVSDVLRSLNGTASKCKTFLATATEECCPARGTLAGHFTRRLSPSPMPGKRIQQQRAYLPLKRSSPRPQFYRPAVPLKSLSSVEPALSGSLCLLAERSRGQLPNPSESARERPRQDLAKNFLTFCGRGSEKPWAAAASTSLPPRTIPARGARWLLPEPPRALFPVARLCEPRRLHKTGIRRACHELAGFRSSAGSRHGSRRVQAKPAALPACAPAASPGTLFAHRPPGTWPLLPAAEAAQIL